MSLPDFIDDFLGKRGLEGPDGRRLFEYECQDWEYRELREELRGLGDPLHLRQQVSGYGEVVGDAPDWNEEALRTMAAFVLYGGEWFRRYEPPPRRTWARLFAEIRWPERNYPELYLAIMRGLEWWRTTAIRTPSKTLYFDTLAYQGGWRVEGLLVMEFRLVDESDYEARYTPTSAPAWFQADGIRVEKREPGPAPARISATFNLGWDPGT